MFSEDMTPGDAQAELHSLKFGLWATGLELLEQHVPSPETSAPDQRADWLDVPGFGCVDGEAAVLYCRTVLDRPDRPLIAMVAFGEDRLKLPEKHRRKKWNQDTPVDSPNQPRILAFREAMGLTSDLLTTHIPLRRNAEFGGSSLTDLRTVYEAVPRGAVLLQITSPKLGFVAGARFGFRKGSAVLWLADPEHEQRVRFVPEFVRQAQGQGLSVEETDRFYEDLTTLHGFTQSGAVQALVPQDEGVPQLRVRAARG